MALEITPALSLLDEHHLLKEVVNEQKLTFENVTYDSRKVSDNTLFFCKGNFKPSYLTSALEKGGIAYVSEQKYAEGMDATGIIVTNVQKAMALLGAAFYGFPQNELFIIAYTGTKGKTTSAYFAEHILAKATDKKVALFSTIDRVLGNEPDQRFKSDLTTPESLDLFHDMRAAVNNGMTHLVMEVSSQAYKKNRVYGLTFDVGVFLNISPDHIGRNEHPTFDDYLHCKEQLLVNSKRCVINGETAYLRDVYYTAKATTEPEDIYVFARKGAQISDNIPVDIEYQNDFEDLHKSVIEVKGLSDKAQTLHVDGKYELSVPGDYNEGNATSAIIATLLAGAKGEDARKTLDRVHIPGRMEIIKTKNNGTIYVDYAHNYASLKALFAFLKQQTHAGRVIAVLGSPGDKGISRRPGFGKAVSEEVDHVILTTDDPGFEDPMKIAQEIDSYINHDNVKVEFELDREMAIEKAIKMSTNNDIVVLAGKGEDPYQKIKGVDVPYPSDVNVAKKIVEEL